jgi:hypothetical protein
MDDARLLQQRTWLGGQLVARRRYKEDVSAAKQLDVAGWPDLPARVLSCWLASVYGRLGWSGCITADGYLAGSRL